MDDALIILVDAHGWVVTKFCVAKQIHCTVLAKHAMQLQCTTAPASDSTLIWFIWSTVNPDVVVDWLLFYAALLGIRLPILLYCWMIIFLSLRSFSTQFDLWHVCHQAPWSNHQGVLANCLWRAESQTTGWGINLGRRAKRRGGSSIFLLFSEPIPESPTAPHAQASATDVMMLTVAWCQNVTNVSHFKGRARTAKQCYIFVQITQIL